MEGALKRLYRAYEGDFSGACLVKTEGQILLSEASGYANMDFQAPNRIDTKFDTASVTTAFTAAAVLLLIQRGKLRFDDRITELLSLPEGSRIPRDVTIGHLLTHTSGIADDADEEAGEEYSDLFIHKPNYSVRRCADILPNFVYREPVFKAGTGVRYNNCAFVLLGLAMERITGGDCRDFMAGEVFKACGMESTFFGARDEICPGAAEGYFALRDGDGKFIKWKKNIYSYPPVGTPDGGAFTTVGDLDRFLRALKNGGLLSKEYSEMLFQPHCPFTREHRTGTWATGYAFEFIRRRGKIFCMYKEGGNPGVDAMLAYFPALDVTVSLLSNREGPMWKLYSAIRDLMMEAFDRLP